MTKPTSNLRLQPTDFEYFEALCEGRFLTTSQVAEQFKKHRTSINRRLAKLEKHGYVARDRESVTKDAIWRPTNKALVALKKAGHVDTQASLPKTIPGKSKIKTQAHETDVNTLRLAFLQQAKQYSQVSVTQCLAGPQFKDHVHDSHHVRYHVHPDRFLELNFDGQRHFYVIEVDRGSKDLTHGEKRGSSRSQDVQRQLFAYSVYYRQGGFAKKYGRPGDRPQDFPFRLLVTAPDQTRRNSMIDTVIRKMMAERYKPPASTFRGYALFEEAAANPYAAIWLRELELYKILAWLEQLPPGRSLAAALPAGQYREVLEAINPETLKLSYRPRVKPNTAVRDALIDALIKTGRVRRYSILEHWPKEQGL